MIGRHRRRGWSTTGGGGREGGGGGGGGGGGRVTRMKALVAETAHVVVERG